MLRFSTNSAFRKEKKKKTKTQKHESLCFKIHLTSILQIPRRQKSGMFNTAPPSKNAVLWRVSSTSARKKQSSMQMYSRKKNADTQDKNTIQMHTTEIRMQRRDIGVKSEFSRRVRRAGRI